MNIRKNRGFTLVELLIVIGLLGAIALIVISAINPIEQANRARDARFNADASQIVSAIERYFAAHSTFPWMDCGVTDCASWDTADDAFDFIGVGSIPVGLCGASPCTTGGLLVTGNELKTEFLSRDFIKKPTDQTTASQIDQKIFIGKGAGSSSSVYACYVPLAKSNREKAITDNKVRQLSFDSAGLIQDSTACTTAADAGWVNGSCVTCVPN
jgi:prepilin-type N-terminal cleavage/methylation domain-containing protein